MGEVVAILLIIILSTLIGVSFSKKQMKSIESSQNEEKENKMSKKIGILYHPINNHPEEIYEGFSWPCLFFGFMWYLVKGMFGWAIVSFLVAGFTFGISLLVFPFFANNHRKESLLNKGYLSEPKSNK